MQNTVVGVKVKKYIRVEMTIFKIFFGEVYCRVLYGCKLPFTALLMLCYEAIFLTIYLMIHISDDISPEIKNLNTITCIS